MRFWDLSDPEIAAADAEPWSGPLSGAMRPIPMRTATRLVLMAGVLSVQAPIVVFILRLAAADEMVHPVAATYNVGFVAVYGLLLPVWLAALPARAVRSSLPLAVVLSVLAMGVVCSVGMWAAGPELGAISVLYLEALPFAFYLLRLRWALLIAGNAVAGCGLVFFLQDGWPAPFALWLVVASTVLATAWILGVVAERADRLADSEREARVELAYVNRTLEERVDSQVTEIEQLGGLRRFLSSQVADAVLSGDSEEVTKPHRRRIAVFFCDLRGFTAFTNGAEPEEVIEVTDEYYRTVGGLLQEHGATIGSYAGDGVMAYFGDPVPHPDPAFAALTASAALGPAMDRIASEWQRQGFELSYGIGVAFGYATLGVVGFDGRYDYTPLGGVVNLAARLCSAAGPGEVLLDHATSAAVSGRLACEPVEGLDLKGYATDTRAYRLA
ncbi:MAG TPA: adenylate/guanylate cyclase domain-containing protein [Nocardioidaceae bacterium]|nr:adenylate/guanylate cyclase domain-containing protein [Nocardioidaceae bacterium]